jgi:uncharacterized protein (TIGR02679 family)
VKSTRESIDRFRRPEYRRLFAAARRSLEHTGGDLGRSVAVGSPNEAERKAIISMTGHYRPPVAGRVAVRLADLDEAAREATGLPLRDLLAQLAPPSASQPAAPLTDQPPAPQTAQPPARLTAQPPAPQTAQPAAPLAAKPADGAAEDAAAGDGIRLAEGSFLMASAGWYASWLDRVVRGGDAGGRRELARAVRVLEYLAGGPAGRVVMLGAVAEAVTGDPAALNDGTALAALVLGALAARADAAAPRSAADRRRLWESADVVADDLASRVLVLNLAADGTGLGEWLTGAARSGTPCYVTMHQLMSHAVAISAGIVFACQRRAVLRRAAADLAAASAPLLCAEGQPSAAFRRLAEIIAGGGGELRYHGDFDWPPMAAAATLIDRYQARAWRMTAADYLAGADASRMALTGTPQPTPWDPGLARAMRQTGRAVPEESMADQLLDDLRRGA